MIDDHIIAERDAYGAWPAHYAQALATARREHDEGLVTMCQGRRGSKVIQYAIPVKGKPVRRAPYFSKRDYTC